MKKQFFLISVSLITFFIGFFLISFYELLLPKDAKIVIPKKVNLTAKSNGVIHARSGAKEAKTISLDDFWLGEETFSYNGFTLTKKCYDDYDFDYEQCKLRLIKNGKIIQEVVNYESHPLKYGIFNLLGKKDKQLILYKGEGGSCFTHTYLIYDLQPKLRLIYDSREFQKESTYINFNLTPIDIDKDGVFEFTRAIHTFDYFYASHVDSVYPTAVFAYDKRLGKYKFANKQFSDFIIDKLKKDFKLSGNFESNDKSIDRKYFLRKIFLELIYSGRKDRGWEFFRNNYDFEDKKDFGGSLKKELKSCPLYQELYQF